MAAQQIEKIEEYQKQIKERLLDDSISNQRVEVRFDKYFDRDMFDGLAEVINAKIRLLDEITEE